MSNTKIKFTIQNYGEIIAELYPEHAPATVENFLKLVNEGFFEGLIFHRVIPGFMIQGGGFEPDFSQKKASSQLMAALATSMQVAMVSIGAKLTLLS